MPSLTNRSASPITPRPMRRIRWASSVISGSGYWLASITFSRKWVDRWTTWRRWSQSICPSFTKAPEVDRAEVADVVWKEGLLAAGVGGLVGAEVRHRIVVVGLVDEEHPRLARLPGAVDDLGPDLTRVQLADHLPRLGVQQVVHPVRVDRRHEGVGDRDRDVEVGDLGRVVLAGDELHDVRVVHPEDAHVGAAAGAALLDDVGRGVEQAHERHRPRGHAHRGADDVVLGTEPREAEPGAAAALVHQRHRAQRVVDPALAVRERVVDRQDEAGGELAQGAAGVHEGRRVGHEQPLRHEPVERVRHLVHRAHRAHRDAVAAVGLRDRPRHPPEEILRCLRRPAGVVLDEVALLEHRDGVGRKRDRVPWGGRFHGAPRMRDGKEESAATAPANPPNPATDTATDPARMSTDQPLTDPEAEGQSRPWPEGTQ